MKISFKNYMVENEYVFLLFIILILLIIIISFIIAYKEVKNANK